MSFVDILFAALRGACKPSTIFGQRSAPHPFDKIATVGRAPVVVEMRVAIVSIHQVASRWPVDAIATDALWFV